IDARGSEQMALERRLVREFALAEAIVAPSAAKDSAVSAVVAYAAGLYLASEVRDGMSLAVGWGSTLSYSLKAIGDRHVAGLSVISLLGGMTHSRAVNPSAVARRRADPLGADSSQL